MTMPIRNSLETVAIAVEGSRDDSFILHMRDKAHFINNLKDRKTILTEISHGGNAISVVKLVAYSFSEQKIALVDGDRFLSFPHEKEEAFLFASETGVEIITLTPCLEAHLLAIIGDSTQLSSASCANAKVQIQRILKPPDSRNRTFKEFLADEISIGRIQAIPSIDNQLVRLLEIFEI